MKKLISFITIISLFSIIAAGCGTSYQAPPPTTSPSPQSPSTQTGTKAQVTIQNFSFQPSELRIKSGTKVTWTNKDSAPHKVVADDNSFSGPELGIGQRYDHVFNKKGRNTYHCGIHTYMKAEIDVE